MEYKDKEEDEETERERGKGAPDTRERDPTFFPFLVRRVCPSLVRLFSISIAHAFHNVIFVTLLP